MLSILDSTVTDEVNSVQMKETIGNDDYDHNDDDDDDDDE